MADTTAMAKDIIKTLESNLLASMLQYKKVRQETFKKENKGHIQPNWQQEGHVLFRIDLRVWDNQLGMNVKAYNWSYSLKNNNEEAMVTGDLEGCYDGKTLTDVEKQQLLQELGVYMQCYIQADTHQLFAPMVEFSIDFESFSERHDRWWLGDFSTIFEFEGADVWVNQLEEYAQRMMKGEESPYSNQRNVYWAIKTFVYKNDWPKMQHFLETFYEKIDGTFFGRECRENTRWIMEALCDTIQEETKVLTSDQQLLFHFTGDILMEYAEDHKMVKKGKKLKKLASDSATKWDKEAEVVILDSPADEDEENEETDMFRECKDAVVVMEAGYYEDGREAYFNQGYDSPGYVSCEILNENEEAYKAAIGFLYGIIKDGFPVRCDFSFKSEEKNYTEIYDYFSKESRFQNESNQFWTNCAKYPALHDAMRNYVKLAAKKVKKIHGDEMEEDDSSYRRPDFYAATVLTLMDPTGRDFLESLDIYASSIDVAYAQDINYVGYSFLCKYGITSENATNLVLICNCGWEELLENFLERTEEKSAALQLLIQHGEKIGIDMEALGLWF